jgi:flavin-dependent dehydrogenase
MSLSIAIIGAGPSACALACFLSERDIACLVFDDAKKPSLLVGESLIPAAMPIIRRLGIEQEVAAISSVKKGAALRHGTEGTRVDFEFRDLGKGISDYAYNIPRPQFDNILRARAEALGVRFVTHKAKVEKCENTQQTELQLADESLVAAGLARSSQPDLLIDATGRSRLFSRTLGLAAKRGPRNDVAHFAHYSNFDADSAHDGQVVISVLDCGWSWQIPLGDTTSVGVVLDGQAAKGYGNCATSRLENVISSNGILNKPDRQRISEVKTYSNYQLMSDQASGPGWILLGDALGFVDPMLSPGVFMALESARLMDKLVFSQGGLRQKGAVRYNKEMVEWHSAWSSLIEYFYDGRMLALGAMRPDKTSRNSSFSLSKLPQAIQKLPDAFVSSVLSGLVSGAGTRSKFNQRMLKHACVLLPNKSTPVSDYAIRDVPKSEGAVDGQQFRSSISEYNKRSMKKDSDGMAA